MNTSREGRQNIASISRSTGQGTSRPHISDSIEANPKANPLLQKGEEDEEEERGAYWNHPKDPNNGSLYCWLCVIPQVLVYQPEGCYYGRRAEARGHYDHNRGQRSRHGVNSVLS